MQNINNMIFLFMFFKYSILIRIFSNSSWQISSMACPSVSTSSDSTSLSALDIVEIGTHADRKYFHKVTFWLGFGSKYTAA